MFKRVPSARTKADNQYAADCFNVQPHYWQYSCYVHFSIDGFDLLPIHPFSFPVFAKPWARRPILHREKQRG
jgi:hypothetical protein